MQRRAKIQVTERIGGHLFIFRCKATPVSVQTLSRAILAMSEKGGKGTCSHLGFLETDATKCIGLVINAAKYVGLAFDEARRIHGATRPLGPKEGKFAVPRFAELCPDCAAEMVECPVCGESFCEYCDGNGGAGLCSRCRETGGDITQ